MALRRYRYDRRHVPFSITGPDERIHDSGLLETKRYASGALSQARKLFVCQPRVERKWIGPLTVDRRLEGTLRSHVSMMTRPRQVRRVSVPDGSACQTNELWLTVGARRVTKLALRYNAMRARGLARH